MISNPFKKGWVKIEDQYQNVHQGMIQSDIYITNSNIYQSERNVSLCYSKHFTTIFIFFK